MHIIWLYLALDLPVLTTILEKLFYSIPITLLSNNIYVPPIADLLLQEFSELAAILITNISHFVVKSREESFAANCFNYSQNFGITFIALTINGSRIIVL